MPRSRYGSEQRIHRLSSTSRVPTRNSRPFSRTKRESEFYLKTTHSPLSKSRITRPITQRRNQFLFLQISANLNNGKDRHLGTSCPAKRLISTKKAHRTVSEVPQVALAQRISTSSRQRMINHSFLYDRQAVTKTHLRTWDSTSAKIISLVEATMTCLHSKMILMPLRATRLRLESRMLAAEAVYRRLKEVLDSLLTSWFKITCLVCRCSTPLRRRNSYPSASTFRITFSSTWAKTLTLWRFHPRQTSSSQMIPSFKTFLIFRAVVSLAGANPARRNWDSILHKRLRKVKAR